MTAIAEVSAWASEVTQLETTDLVLGGSGGPDNRALKQLADRTRYLLDRVESLTELPVLALPFPTIATTDNRLSITPLGATAGGRVSVAAGTLITFSEVVVSGQTGRLRTLTTTAYTSADLLVSSTYYLRARINAGALQLYVQRGTDVDATPATLVGTPDGASGGGFESTVHDVLLAKVVTNLAGGAPVVTALANAQRLVYHNYRSTTSPQVVHPTLSQLEWTQTVVLNWARAPVMSNVTGLCWTGTSGQVADGWSARARVTASSRYSLTCYVTSDWATDMTYADKNAEMTILALA